MAKRNYTLDNAGGDEAQETPETPAAQPQMPVAQPPPLPVIIDKDEDDEPQEDVKLKEPANLKDAYALLGKANAMPESTKKEKRVKEQCMAFAKKHCYRLQQGIPDVPASVTMRHLTQQVSSLKHERLHALARTNPDVQELIDERDSALARCKALEEKLAELTAKP